LILDFRFKILDFGLIPRINPGACTTFEILSQDSALCDRD